MVTGFVQLVGGTVEAALVSVKVLCQAHRDVEQLFDQGADRVTRCGLEAHFQLPQHFDTVG